MAQVYVAPPARGVKWPVHELKGFQKIFLSPGEKQTVQLEMEQSFAYFDEAKNGWVVPASIESKFGDSSQNLLLNKSMEW